MKKHWWKWLLGLAVITVAVVVLLAIFRPVDIRGGLHVFPCTGFYNNEEVVLYSAGGEIIGETELVIDVVDGKTCVYKFEFINAAPSDFYVLEINGQELHFSEQEAQDGIVLFARE